MTSAVPPSSSRRLRLLDFSAVCLASVFFLSYLPSKLIVSFQLRFRRKTLEERKWTGAGMVGSLAGALTYALLPKALAQSAVMILLGIILSIAVSHRAEKVLRHHDDSRIVIDEWIGAWIALWGLPRQLGLEFIAAFVLFRFFDVFKGPWGHRLQKLPGGFGVVMDDVVAGLLANVCVRALLFFIERLS